MENKLRMILRCAGGGTVSLAAPRTLALARALDTPAASLEIAFAVAGQIAPAIDLRLYDGATLLFSGCCDEQELSVGPDGRLLTLSARSLGGLLLDNEMMPQVFYNITARQFFRRFLEPYGFGIAALPSGSSAGIFRVNKGMSIWQAFTQLCFLLYGRAPTVTADDAVYLGRPSLQVAHTISNRANLPDALRYCTLRELHRRSSVISEAVSRNRAGAYCALLRNPYANPWEVRRRRYVIPAAEFEEAPRLDALQRITEAQRGAHSILAALPGLHPVAAGALVLLDDPWLGKRKMTVYRSALTFDRDGAFTRLLLADPLYV